MPAGCIPSATCLEGSLEYRARTLEMSGLDSRMVPKLDQLGVVALGDAGIKILGSLLYRFRGADSAR